jgi:hypothetical protein
VRPILVLEMSTPLRPRLLECFIVERDRMKPWRSGALGDGEGMTDPNVDMDRKTFARHEATLAVILDGFFLRQLLAVYAAFEGDVLRAIVLGEVARHNLSAHTTAAETPRELSATIRNDTTDRRHVLLPSNAYSVAHTTGIPRETVRRKIDALLRHGWFVKDQDVHLYVTRAALAHFSDFNFERLGDLLRTEEHIRDVVGRAALLKVPGRAVSPPRRRKSPLTRRWQTTTPRSMSGGVRQKLRSTPCGTEGTRGCPK